MDAWKQIPWWIRMILSVIVMAVGGLLLYAVATGGDGSLTGSRRGGPFMVPGLILVGGLIMFATSFPYDNDGGYNF